MKNISRYQNGNQFWLSLWVQGKEIKKKTPHHRELWDWEVENKSGGRRKTWQYKKNYVVEKNLSSKNLQKNIFLPPNFFYTA